VVNNEHCSPAFSLRANHNALRKDLGVSGSSHESCFPVCKMRFLVCALLSSFLLPISVRSEVSGEIPFQYRDGLIWLKVEVARQGERLNFLLDSGAGASVIDLQIARSLGVKVGNRQTVEGVNGQAVAYRVSDFRAVTSGIVLPKSVLAIDLRTLSDCCQQPVDGILGADFFRHRIVQIDFAAGRVRLLKNCDLNLPNEEILPIKIFNDAFCVPVGVAGNPPQWMRLDTGCDAALEWVGSWTEKRVSRRTSIGLSSRSVRYIDTSVQIGKQRFTAVATGVHKEQIFSGETGLLGNDLLSKFRLTIDEPRRRAILEKVR
jgi:aspartyl protease